MGKPFSPACACPPICSFFTEHESQAVFQWTTFFVNFLKSPIMNLSSKIKDPLLTIFKMTCPLH